MTLLKAVVTGGCGFIGSHLVDNLLSQNTHVTVVDNCETGNLSNIEQLDHPSLRIIQEDISQEGPWQSLLGDAEVIYHLAGLADIVPSIDNPSRYFEVNVTGTLNVLEAMRLGKCRRIVYAASASCYGKAKNFPTKEDHEVSVEYPYALTKLVGEQLVEHWSKTYNFSFNSARLFNVYGPRSRTTGAYGAVFGVFLKQKLVGSPFTVVGDGRQARDFTFVSDVVDALVQLGQFDNPNACNEIFNVCASSPVSINKLVDLLGGDVVFIPRRPGEPDITHGDNGKLMRLTQWSPKISIEDGVKVMLSEIKKWEDAPLWDENSITEATRNWFKFLEKD